MEVSLSSISDSKTVIVNFAAYLKKADKELKNLRSQVQTIVDARNAFSEHLSNLLLISDYCNTVMLPEYEKNVYA